MIVRAMSWLVLLVALVSASVMSGLWAADSDRAWPLAGVLVTGVVAGALIIALRAGPDIRHAHHAGSVGWMLLALVLLHALVGMLLFPLTLEDGVEPDLAWFALAPLISVVGLGGAYVLGVLVALLVLLPIFAIARHAGRAGTDRVAGYVTALSTFLLSMTLWAGTVGLLAYGAIAHAERAPRGVALAWWTIVAMLGLRDLSPDLPLPWLFRILAWALFAVMVGSAVVMIRTGATLSEEEITPRS